MMAKKVVTFGEIMLRFVTPQYQRFLQATEYKASYGGAEANVAVSLANFGVDVSFVTRIPQNDIAKACKMELQKYSVGIDHIVYGGDRLGTYYLETGAVARTSKVIYDRAHSAFSQIKPGMINWEEVLKDADFFHWTGITPAISQGAANACLEAIQVANRLGLTVSTDLNYRQDLWNYGKKAIEVMPELIAGCDIVLGNEEDIFNILGISSEGLKISQNPEETEVHISVAKQIMVKYARVKKVIITLKDVINANQTTWSGVLYDGKTLFRAPSYKITHIVDHVGDSDSFMGGLIYGFLAYAGDDQSALNFATAASCLKHTIHGDYNLVTVKEVEKLMGGDASGRVAR
jgi:2-dehydro-3-deoxygluconokinase